MDYNPLNLELRALENKLTALTRRRAALASEVSWARRFRLKTARENEARLAKELERKKAELERLDAKCSEATATSELLNAQTGVLEDDASLGWNPIWWFSEERSQAKERLERHLERISSHLLSCEDLASQRDGMEREVRTARDALHLQREEIATFNEFDQKATAAKVQKIDEELPLREVERDALRIRKQEVDRHLKAPLAEMDKYADEIGDLRKKNKKLRKAKEDAEYTRDEADRLNQKISNASNSYERRELHMQSERLFGNGSPGRVVSEQDRQIRSLNADMDRNKRQIAGIERNVEKVKRRIERLGEVASRDIRLMIIDGKNVCFEGNRFIGFASLIPLVEQLSEKYDVTVVFDASIRRDMQLGDEDLRRALPNSKVHVVASRMKADETILEAAREPTAWVLSNDRFGEYREKPPVKEGRIIRHEILHGRVMVHELGISAKFENRHH